MNQPNYGGYYNTARAAQPQQQQYVQQQPQVFVYTDVPAVDAENWPILPGNTLIFLNQSLGEVYVKNLGFQPGARPEFTPYFAKHPMAQEPTPTPVGNDISSLESDIAYLKKEFKKLKNKLVKGNNNGEDDS